MDSPPKQNHDRRAPGTPGTPGAARPAATPRQPTSSLAARRTSTARPTVTSPAPALAARPTEPAPQRGVAGSSSILAIFSAGWVLVPLRLFLGVTFVYAGLQKLSDPQFFNSHAFGYIGRQIQDFAHGSPIGGLLLTVALPHAAFYGGLIAYGELAIGLGTLIGLFARPAACFGLLLSLIFFLSASWNVHPYFYGADIVFVFAWLTLGLQPHAGLPNLDERVVGWLADRWPRWVAAHPTSVALLFSTSELSSAAQAPGAAAITPRRPGATAAGRGRHAGRSSARLPSRREFLFGLGAGAAGTLGLVWLWSALHPTAAAPTTGGSGAAGLPTATATTTPGATVPTSGNLIAHASDVPANSSASFTIPSSGDPGVLVHLNDGRFVAFDATCTHAGCPVQYDPSSADLICPCHGAVFDPAHNAAVLQGPTNAPLTPVAVTVQSNGDIVLS